MPSRYCNNNYNDFFKIGSLNEIDKMEIFYLSEIKKIIINHLENIVIKYDF